MAKQPKPAKPAKDPKKPGRIKQIRQSYTMTKESDPRIGLILLGTFLLAGLLGFAVMLLLFRGSLVFPILFGVLVGLLAALIIFGRRAQSAAISQIEGKPGAAAAALGMLKRGWKTEPAIAITKQQDIVTRVVGPPGIVLIGEGNPNRLRPMMSSERRKHERVASETKIHEVIVGHDQGQVPLAKLTRHVTKLGKDLKPAQMTDVLARIKALDANRSNIPMPKGPVPTSMKGMRGNQRGR
jgi:MFS superfamily sulfate permease-like transporter